MTEPTHEPAYLLSRFSINPQTNCWEWKNTSPSGEPRRLWLPSKGRHIPAQRLIWDHICPDDLLDRNHSLRRLCHTASCVSPEHHVKVKRTGKPVKHTPLSASGQSLLARQARASHILARALDLATSKPWALVLFLFTFCLYWLPEEASAGPFARDPRLQKPGWATEYPVGTGVHTDKATAIEYARESARTNCGLLKIIRDGAQTVSGRTFITKIVRDDVPHLSVRRQWIVRAYAECDVFAPATSPTSR